MSTCVSITKIESSKVYFYLCELIIFWVDASLILSRLIGLLSMLEGIIRGYVYSLIIVLFGLKAIFFCTTFMIKCWKKIYVILSSLAMSLMLCGIALIIV